MKDGLGSVALTDVVRYAGASGDLNPIHYDPEFARSAGYPGPFSMGALHGSWLLSHAFASGASVDRGAATSVRLRFKGIVELGVELTAEVAPEGVRVIDTLNADDKPVVVVDVGPLEQKPVPAEASERSDEQRCRFPVELGSVRRFAEAIRWPHEVGPGLPAPPTYLSALSFWLPRPDPIERIGFDRARTLLGETTVEFVSGPICADEVFDVVEFVTNTRTRQGTAGVLTLVDLVAELSDADGLRAVYRNTFVLTSAAPDPDTPPPTVTLRGSRDPRTQEVFYPSRSLSVDGRLRECEDVDLATTGVLWSWTTYGGRAFGQVDLDDGVRLQGPLLGQDHEIGATYRTVSATGEDWCFARA